MREISLKKRFLDIVISLFGLIIVSPLFLLIAILVSTTSKSPAIFAHKRIGKDGVPFILYKFRTMRKETPAYLPKPKRDDPNITKIGKFLRDIALDELPQLINVLKGEMSLVGPRPELPFVVEDYTETQKERLSVKPGITGLWQLSGKVKEPIHHNLEYDLNYIRNQSLLLDFKVLFRTFVISFRMLKSALFNKS